MAAHRLAPKGIPDLVASWDFAAVLRGRRLHSRREGKLIDDYSSNYALYVRPRGCGFGGMMCSSPMDEVAGLGWPLTRRNGCLHSPARSVFLGPSQPFCTCWKWTACRRSSFWPIAWMASSAALLPGPGYRQPPPNSPLDRSPWFTYQGFDLRRPTDPWRVEFAAFATDATWQDKLDGLKATSTKAAYLWLALRPNAQSRALVRSMRSLARHDLGFELPQSIT